MSFLEGNARKWLISSWGPEASGRPASWHEFRAVLKEAFSECHSDEISCVCLFRTKQDGPLEEYISKFMGGFLSARGTDDLARTMLFIEGLSSTEIRTEVRREHPQTSEDAIRTARTARVSLNDSRQDADGGIATMRSKLVTGRWRFCIRNGSNCFDRAGVFIVGSQAILRSYEGSSSRTPDSRNAKTRVVKQGVPKRAPPSDDWSTVAGGNSCAPDFKGESRWHGELVTSC